MGYISDALSQFDANDDRPLDRSSVVREGHPVLRFTADNEPRVFPNHEEGDEGRSFVGPGLFGPTPPDPSGETVDLSANSVDDRIVALSAPSGLMAEEYRAVRTGLIAKWGRKRHVAHTITSATPQEGKTITSLNLGLIFGELPNRKTIVVEADLRLPQFKKLMSLPPSPGLLGILKGEAKLPDAVQRVDGRSVSFLQAGSRGSNEAVQLLASPQMSNLLVTLRKQYDHIIVDTPPVGNLADAGMVGAQSDDVLMIVRMNRTPRALVEQAIRTLATYNAPVTGLIATDQNRLRRRYSYQYGYRYHAYKTGRSRAA